MSLVISTRKKFTMSPADDVHERRRKPASGPRDVGGRCRFFRRTQPPFYLRVSFRRECLLCLQPRRLARAHAHTPTHADTCPHDDRLMAARRCACHRWRRRGCQGAAPSVLLAKLLRTFGAGFVHMLVTRVDAVAQFTPARGRTLWPR